MYNSRIWLNEDVESAFIEITDCYHKIRLHVGHGYDYSAYIAKIDKMIDELTKYKNHLEGIKNDSR